MFESSAWAARKLVFRDDQVQCFSLATDPQPGQLVIVVSGNKKPRRSGVVWVCFGLFRGFAAFGTAPILADVRCDMLPIGWVNHAVTGH